MRYIVTKEQYTKLVNNLINIFFKDVKVIYVENSDSIEFFVDDEEVAWIAGVSNPVITKKCKNELIIFTETLDKMKNFAPLFRKKLFAKLMIDHFRYLTGIDIDCFWIDEEGNHNDDTAFKYRIKKNKKK
jgi:hypothetical protein